MMTSWHGKVIVIAGCALLGGVLPGASARAARDQPSELIVCDDLGSPAHAIGVGLELLVKLELLPTTGIDITSSTRSGSSDCQATMMTTDSTLAILDGTSLESLALRSRSLREASGVRPLLVASLWRQAAHFLIAKDHRLSGTIGDFALLSADQRVIDQDLWDRAPQLLAKAGITIDRPRTPLTRDALIERFNRGNIIGIALLEPVPSPIVAEFLAKTGGRAMLLELNERYIEADGNGWRPQRIPAASYPAIGRPIETFGNRVMLIAEADVADETVYQLTKILFNNLPKLGQVHEIAAQISVDQALEDADLPLHPGAARYYREIGVLPHETETTNTDRTND